MGLYIVAPLPTMDLPQAIKVDLISMPAAPKVKKRIILQPARQKPIVKPVVIPSIQKPKPIIKKVFKPEPKPNIVLNNKSAPISQEIEASVNKPERLVTTEDETSENIQPLESEDVPMTSIFEAGTGAAQIATTSKENDRLQSYSKLIRERINRVKRYPLMARKAGRQGTVAVEFSVNRQGELLGSKIVNSCGTKALDRAALKALRRASPFAKLPDDLSSPHRFNLQINFFLDS